jgi:hypothetical protein
MKNKSGKMRGPAIMRVWLWGFALVAIILLGLVLPAKADNVVQGFKSKGNLSPGWVVALSKNSQDTVEAAPTSDSGRLYGVIVDPSDAPLTLNRFGSDQVFVATTGSYPVATAAFDGKKDVITNSGGFAIGKVVVNISPRKNPLVKNDVAIPGFLRKLGESIAGKPVSALRIYVSLAFLLAAATLSMTLLYAGVRGGMIALGRNPLNRGHIMNSMFKIVTAAAMVFIIGLFGVYLLLKL